MRRLALLVGLGAVPLIGLGGIGLVDYDEAAYGEVARAMLSSGDWLVPHLCGQPWFEKPPLLYWAMAAGMKLAGIGAGGARLGTALAAVAAILALYGFARRPLGERAAFAAALVLAASLEFSALSRLALTDMLLLFWFLVCLGALHRAFELRERGTAWFALACVAAALAVLTKGAIGFLLPGAAGLVELAFRARLRDALRPSWLALGLALVVGVGFSWYLALGLTQPGGFAFARTLFLEHHVGRFTEPMQGHGGSPLYYVPVLLVGLFPWSLLLPLAFARAGLRAGGESARFLRLFAAFSAITVVFFSAAATKLPNYVAPALPGLALPIGALLAAGPRGVRDRAFARFSQVTLGFVASFALVLALLVRAGPRLAAALGAGAARHPALASPLELGGGGAVAAAALVAGAVFAALAWRAARPERALAALACGSLASYAILFWTVLPRLDAQVGAPLRRLAVAAAAQTAPDEPVLMLGLRHRASVCFYAQRATRFASAAASRRPPADVFGPDAPKVGITGEPQLAGFPFRDRLELLERDGGYVLFRIPEGEAASEP